MTRWLAGVALGALVGGCASGAPGPALQGQAVLKDKAGQQVALATITEEGKGVRLEITGIGLPPGPKGIHIHAVGQCDPPEFTTAGAHFNPGGRKHGLQSPEGPHAGDLPNLTVTSAGAAGLDTTIRAVTLKDGAPNSLFGPGGTSLVIHEQPDDQKTDPAGNSGGRIACGVITRR